MASQSSYKWNPNLLPWAIKIYMAVRSGDSAYLPGFILVSLSLYTRLSNQCLSYFWVLNSVTLFMQGSSPSSSKGWFLLFRSQLWNHLLALNLYYHFPLTPILQYTISNNLICFFTYCLTKHYAHLHYCIHSAYESNWQRHLNIW